MKPALRYWSTSKETASKERLMVMLFQAAMRNMKTGEMAMRAQNRALAVTHVTKASDIVTELLSTLDQNRAKEMTQSLADVYLFVISRLTTALMKFDAECVEEAARVFAPVASAFEEAVEQLATGGK